MASKDGGELEMLEDVKKLLVLLLLKLGASQAEIARALGISQPSVSRMIPGTVQPFDKK